MGAMPGSDYLRDLPPPIPLTQQEVRAAALTVAELVEREALPEMLDALGIAPLQLVTADG